MIRINLLKEVYRKKRKPVLDNKKITAITIFAGLCLIFTGGIIGFLHLRNSSPPKLHQEEVVTDYSPSSHLKPGMIEDIVHEINDSREKSIKEGILNIPYQDMSFVEQVNYEVAFGKNVVTMLSRVVPSGIGLNSLELTNFQTVYAHGVGKTKELIASTFNDLKKEKINLLQPPYSYIASDAKNGFKFVVTCKTDFGLNLSDPFQAVDHLGSREELSSILKNIVKIADENRIKFSEPRQISAERVGQYRRFIYKVEGSGIYKDFVRLVLDLYNEQVACAFKKLNIKAKTRSSVIINAELLLTVKD